MSGVPACSRVAWCIPWITPHRRIIQGLGTGEHAGKTHSWIALGTYVVIAIAKHGLPLDRQSVSEIAQILRLALFEQVPVHQLLTP